MGEVHSRTAMAVSCSRGHHLACLHHGRATRLLHVYMSAAFLFVEDEAKHTALWYEGVPSGAVLVPKCKPLDQRRSR